MNPFPLLSKTQARETASYKETKASILLCWIHAGHPATNLRMHAAIRSLGSSSGADRPRNVEEFRRNWLPSVSAPTVAPKLHPAAQRIVDKYKAHCASR